MRLVVKKTLSLYEASGIIIALGNVSKIPKKEKNMKKSLFVYPIVALATIAASGAIIARSNNAVSLNAKVSKISRATDSTASYIHVNRFTAYRDGNVEPLESFPVKDRNARFWGEARSFNAITPFVTTIEGSPADGESWTGHFDSPSFIAEAGKYISFTIGGNSANYAKIFKDDVEVATILPTFNGPELANNMILKYYQVPADKGGNYKIKFYDTTTSDYGGIVFGAVQYNQTLEDLARTFSIYKNNLPWVDRPDVPDSSDGSNIRSSRWIMNYIYVTENAYYAPLNNYVLRDVDEGFEKGEASLNNWAWDGTYSNIEPTRIGLEGTVGCGINWGAAVDETNEHGDAEKMPYNKTGDKYFKGYHEGGQGAYAGDNSKYRLLSAEFTLSGSGFVSVKMSGSTASVHVLQYDSHTPGSVVAEKDGRLVEKAFYDRMNFQSDGDKGNMQESGFNTNTMTRHILDLREYLGQKIVLGLSDWGDAGWGAVNYDELVTYYEETPTFQVDDILQDYNGGVHVVRYDRFQIGKHADESALPSYVETSNIRSAFDFLESYHNVMRPNGKGNTYCEIINSDDVGNIITAYNALGDTNDGKGLPDAKTLARAAEDYRRNPEGEGAYYARSLVKNTVGETIDYVVEQRSLGSGINTFAGLSNGNAFNSGLIAIISAGAVAVVTFAVVSIKKKRQN